MESQVTTVSSHGPEPLVHKKFILMGIAIAYVLISSFMIVRLRLQVATLEQNQAESERRFSGAFSEIDGRFRVLSETLASQLGMTQREFETKANELQKTQQVVQSRLVAKQKDELRRMKNQVTGVAVEVGAVKSDVAATKSELEATRAKLERTIGDLGVQSGLIARTHDDLEILKHRGDRNYYEFSLQKGGKPVPISTISLQLKKADAKKNRFTLNVLADDKTIEKKDRNLYEPLQFYTGKDRMLYELVVNDVQKNKISGYLATPKDAPQPVVR